MTAIDMEADTKAPDSVSTADTISAKSLPCSPSPTACKKRGSIFEGWRFESFRSPRRKCQNRSFWSYLRNPLNLEYWISNDSKVAYRPCIRKSFKPLGIVAKVFGLLPCYDLSFVQQLDDRKTKWIHIADYMYSGLICLMMSAGFVISLHFKPAILAATKCGDDEMDYSVMSAMIYITLGIGVWSLFVFPKSWCSLLDYLDHFAHVDKILAFDGRYARQEQFFGKRNAVHALVFMVLSSIVWYLILISDVRGRDARDLDDTFEIRFFDYLLVPIIVLAVMVNMIPTLLATFFMNAIRIRILQFNEKVKKIILPITPSCFACKSFKDYGKELEAKLSEIKEQELAYDLEKLRILHGEVTELVNETSVIFGPHLIRDFMFSITGIIMYTYMVAFLRKDQGPYWSVYIILVIFQAAKVIFLCCFADRIKHEAHDLVKLFHKVSTFRLSKDTLFQVQQFIKKLDEPMVITAYDFFDMDKRLLTSIVGSITMYFVILVQVKLTDFRDDFERVIDTCNLTTSTIDKFTALPPGYCPQPVAPLV